MASNPAAAVDSKSGWYVVGTNTGAIGLVNHTSGSTFNLGNGQTVTIAVWVAPVGVSLKNLVGNYGSGTGPIQKAFSQLGATSAQFNAFIAQSDIGSAKEGNLKQLLFAPSGKSSASTASSPVSTHGVEGDAIPAGVNIPGVSNVLGGVESFVSGILLRGAELIGGIMLLLLGLKTLTGANVPSVL